MDPSALINYATFYIEGRRPKQLEDLLLQNEAEQQDCPLLMFMHPGSAQPVGLYLPLDCVLWLRPEGDNRRPLEMMEDVFPEYEDIHLRSLEKWLRQADLEVDDVFVNLMVRRKGQHRDEPLGVLMPRGAFPYLEIRFGNAGRRLHRLHMPMWGLEAA